MVVEYAEIESERDSLDKVVTGKWGLTDRLGVIGIVLTAQNTGARNVKTRELEIMVIQKRESRGFFIKKWDRRYAPGSEWRYGALDID